MARLDKTGLQYLLDKIHTFLNRFSLKSETVFSVNEETPVDGNVTLNEVPYAGNLISENAQVSRADVLVRTSGGDASISDGDAWLVRLLGNREYSVPPVAEVLEMTVDPIEREEPITAVIDRDTFVGYVESSTILDFYYTTEWSANLALYGITVTGEPVSGDHISINYVKEDRGVIVQSTPSAFVSTGWNLYNASTGRARAVKYSEQYGFKIGGAYTSVSFVEEIGDTPIPITVVSGNFTVPSDGWIIVSGGDSTTYVYMTWSDWTEEPAGSFEMYTQSVIDLSTVMVNFPNGLMRAGNVRDEINLNTLVATSNVERLAYNASNLEIAEQSGREYEVDRDYIYIAKSTPNTYSISVSGAYIASDHGIEFVDGTTIPVFIETLYGNNLKNKLERDVLTISAQELTSAQKTQVRTNVDALGVSDVVNSLTSEITNKPLSAAQGKALRDELFKANYGTATRQSKFLSGGTCKYIRIGNIVLVHIMELIISTDVPSASGVSSNAFFIDLPRISQSGQNFELLQYSTGASLRVTIGNTDSGHGAYIAPHYDPKQASPSQYYGILWYIAAV